MAIVVIVFISISIAMYTYYKMKRFRSPEGTALKQWYQTKAMIALATFITAPGLLFLFTPRGIVDIIIGLIFTALGLVYFYYGVKAYRYIQPIAKAEAEAAEVEASKR